MNSSFLTAGIFMAAGATTLPAAVSQGFRVPDGFEVSLFAGDDLAHDIHSMTTDHRGRIVVGGKGWVKILHDADGDGKAEKATIFTPHPRSGAQGMFFDEHGLVVSGDQGVRRWRDADGDDRADGEPELLIRTERDGEHTAHAIARGPDGWLYLIAGNNTGITHEHAKLPGSPVKQVLTGALLRFLPDGRSTEVIAHGFRNPYDFDFHPLGHLLTYDSDGERDHHLPWWTGTRIFDVGIGAEHGWVLRGSHAWSMPESWFDNTPRLWTVGRGSPAGVLVYRHHAFPSRYREGVFTLCWTMGRVDFTPLTRAGSTFHAPHLETFMEAIGDRGFAPVDAVVDPTGDLFVAIGGRGTVGGVYRVRYTGPRPPAPEPPAPLAQVLDAAQPLASWSRAKWVPLARSLGPLAFERAAADSRLGIAERIRAIEVLVDVFGGLRGEFARDFKRDHDPEIVGRLAWALGRSPNLPEAPAQLASLTHLDEPRIARAAWDAVQSVPSAAWKPESAPDWYRGLDSADARVRAATALAARGAGFISFDATPLPASPTARQQLGRLRVLGPDRPGSSESRQRHVETCVRIFTGTEHSDTKLDAIRLLQLGLGDARPVQEKPETHDGLLAARPDGFSAALRARAVAELAPAFPTGDPERDRELARLLAMLSAEAPGLVGRIVAKITDASAVEQDIHYLMVIARLPGVREAEVTARIARSVAALHHKMNADRKEPSRFWPIHVGAMFSRLLTRDAALGPALIVAPNFNLPAQSLFAARLTGPGKDRAARTLLARNPPDVAPRPGSVRAESKSTSANWTPEFVELLTVLPDGEIFPALRAATMDPTLRDSLALAFARNPQPEDRATFITALSSFQPAVVERAAQALRTVSSRGNSSEIGCVISALRRMCQFPRETKARGALIDLLSGWTGQNPSIASGGDLLQNYAPWFSWFARAHPEESGSLLAGGDGNLPMWTKRFETVAWNAGDARRGRPIFEQRLCARCHEGARIGPDLAGVTSRLSRDDLFAAVLDPNRDISPAWQARQITTRDGRVYTGLIVYDSPTAKLIQTAPDITIRLTGEEIVSNQPSPASLMPPGLLNGLKDGDLADLYAFLKTLGK